jgi:hypothetical protein
MVFDVTQTTFSIIFDLAGVDVIEKTIDSEIPS